MTKQICIIIMEILNPGSASTEVESIFISSAKRAHIVKEIKMIFVDQCSSTIFPVPFQVLVGSTKLPLFKISFFESSFLRKLFSLSVLLFIIPRSVSCGIIYIMYNV